jgi:hypothetical protein
MAELYSFERTDYLLLSSQQIPQIHHS